MVITYFIHLNSIYSVIVLMFQSPEKLSAMNWQNKIEENTSKIGAKFIDYRPETGSWVFEVSGLYLMIRAQFFKASLG